MNIFFIRIIVHNREDDVTNSRAIIREMHYDNELIKTRNNKWDLFRIITFWNIGSYIYPDRI